MLIFNRCLLLRWLKGGKTKAKNGLTLYFTLLFIYFITVNKYRFCISVIGYINVQIIGIGYKKINIGRSLVIILTSELNRSGQNIIYAWCIHPSARVHVPKVSSSLCLWQCALLQIYWLNLSKIANFPTVYTKLPLQQGSSCLLLLISCIEMFNLYSCST